MSASASTANFICTADAKVGFGHLRRCLAIGRELRARGVAISLGGRLDDAARALAHQELPGALLAGEARPPGLAIIDCMFDEQDMDFYDVPFIEEIRRGSRGTALLSSSVQAPPDLPVDLLIGHMLDPIPGAAYALRRGLDWAPVVPEAGRHRRLDRTHPERLRRVLVAPGNFHDPGGLQLALDALAMTGMELEVQILLPPALHSVAAGLCERAWPFPVEVLANVPTVFPLLTRCDLVICSYGNLTFEALCLGVPVVVIAIKEFMARYAARLAAAECLLLGGDTRTPDPASLAKQVRELDQARRTSLAAAGQRLVDGVGLRRTADLLQAWMNGPKRRGP